MLRGKPSRKVIVTTITTIGNIITSISILITIIRISDYGLRFGGRGLDAGVLPVIRASEFFIPLGVRPVWHWLTNRFAAYSLHPQNIQIPCPAKTLWTLNPRIPLILTTPNQHSQGTNPSPLSTAGCLAITPMKRDCHK